MYTLPIRETDCARIPGYLTHVLFNYTREILGFVNNRNSQLHDLKNKRVMARTSWDNLTGMLHWEANLTETLGLYLLLFPEDKKKNLLPCACNPTLNASISLFPHYFLVIYVCPFLQIKCFSYLHCYSPSENPDKCVVIEMVSLHSEATSGKQNLRYEGNLTFLRWHVRTTVVGCRIRNLSHIKMFLVCVFMSL